MNEPLYLQGYTQNRELSWLRFNERVLAEAADESVPLLERLKFVAIFTSNLEEFFMIRVGSLYGLHAMYPDRRDEKSGLTSIEQIDAIYTKVRPLCRKRNELFEDIMSQLRNYDISMLRMSELKKKDREYVRDYFRTEIEPILSPQIMDTHHPFPHLQSGAIYVGTLMERKGEKVFGLIPLPGAIPDVLFLPGNGIRFMETAEILLEYAEKVFPVYSISSKASLAVTRNADISPDDEPGIEGEDFRELMANLLKKRRRLAPVRLETSEGLSKELSTYFCERLKIAPHQIFASSAPMRMKFAFQLEEKLQTPASKMLLYKPFSPQKSPSVPKNARMTNLVKKKDLLLSYPFESMDPFLDLVKEASEDPDTVSIKITIYRLASKARLIDYLCHAAERGIDVTVLIELRARFDEQNNIDWSWRLEEAGCNLIYGFENYKVHSKICLITRKEKGEVKHITQVGTGNYNENTAKAYTDLCLITADPAIGADANNFFKCMAIGDLEGEYEKLLVAPNSCKNEILSLIDSQILEGDEGRIVIKMNSLTDADIIRRLRDASCAGVSIELIVRGICCLLPDVLGHTENIRIMNVVGRFLEHSRIYCFGKGDEEKIYISSADMMTRNMERRVELACPVEDEDIRNRIRKIIDTVRRDNVKARIMQSDGEYMVPIRMSAPLSSQDIMMQKAIEAAKKRKKAELPDGPGLRNLVGDRLISLGTSIKGGKRRK